MHDHFVTEAIKALVLEVAGTRTGTVPVLEYAGQEEVDHARVVAVPEDSLALDGEGEQRIAGVELLEEQSLDCRRETKPQPRHACTPESVEAESEDVRELGEAGFVDC